jgi:hypothetical protein
VVDSRSWDSSNEFVSACKKIKEKWSWL